VNKIVRDLNEDIKEKQTVSQPVAKETTQLNLLNLDDEAPVQKFSKPEPVVASTPTPPTEKVTLNMDEEEPYSLFSMLDTTKEETTSENVVVFEFETTHQEPVEELIEETAPVIETIEITEEPMVSETPEIESTIGEEKEEESFVVFNVKSYETNTNEPISKEILDQQLNDRKRILSQLSYRSLNKGNLNELESTPAYLRKGVEVQNTMHSNTSDLSRFTIGEDTVNQRPEVKKNNSFLHDNVD
jgi:cell division protein FtsZ